MDEIAATGRPPAMTGTIVVLLVAEALGALPDPAALRATFAARDGPVRGLVRVTGPSGFALAERLRQDGIATELLLGPAMAGPGGGAPAARMPPGSTPAELDAIALALSDVVLAVPGAENTEAVRDLLAKAKALGKPICPPGCALSCVAASIASVAHKLDPDGSGWHRYGRRSFGRVEQGLLEALAFGWRGGRDGRARSRRRLKQCVSKSWVPGDYFAPPNWSGIVPDGAAKDASAPLVAQFQRLDRCALYGSYIHRDVIWFTHIAAAFAVLFAVTGALLEPSGLGLVFMIGELVLLVCIGTLIAASRRSYLQERWTACRLGAEQLRIARMCLPLLVVPPALTAVEDPAAEGEADYTGRALLEVQRAVRDQGLPRLKPDYSAMQAAAWLDLIVADQTGYHRDNHTKLEHAERRLRFFATVFFTASVVAVVTHFFAHAEWLLLFTAAGPAFAAALHGAETRLGIVHRGGLSQDAHRDLGRIGDLLGAFLTQPPASEEAAWVQVRALALRAAEAMGQENKSWHRLLRRERDSLPA